MNKTKVWRIFETSLRGKNNRFDIYELETFIRGLIFPYPNIHINFSSRWLLKDQEESVGCCTAGEFIIAAQFSNCTVSGIL